MTSTTIRKTSRRAAFLAVPLLCLGLLTAGPASAAQWDTSPTSPGVIATGSSATVVPGGDLRVDVIFGDASTWPAEGLFATVIYTPAGGGTPVPLASQLPMTADRGVTLTAPLGLTTTDQSGMAAPVGTVTTTVTDAAGVPLTNFGGAWTAAADPAWGWAATENVVPTCLTAVPEFAHANGGGVRMAGAPSGPSCEDGPSEIQTIAGPTDVTVQPTSPLMARFVGGETVIATVTSESGDVVGRGEWVYDGLTRNTVVNTPAELSGLSTGTYTVTWTGASTYADGASFTDFAVQQSFRYVLDGEVPAEPVDPEVPVTPVDPVDPEVPVIPADPEAPAEQPVPVEPEVAPEQPAPAVVTEVETTPVAPEVAPTRATPQVVIQAGLAEEPGTPVAGIVSGGALVAGAGILGAMAVSRRLSEGL
ncbi:hypothetical protein Sked_28970 [Sanguibacter keddieii DSM 10542]|uniref:Uncharacterized protein n=1 Tax=Sanguibacter keddieii (strain ATCC 51767 / DSM 10542 / NCFB 3025 / ST-74) TaxID=446469 RepID=D1BBM8_SANKS|nr:hypothetical protein [Sanguibacter keddieii]ACZ22799.1 hypothetical protein Sked_28970 [Sanguibacter keddieii DSM 10542]